MEEQEKSERLQFSMTAADREKLVELARVNTGNNLSFLIRDLIRKAYDDPQGFGLREVDKQ